MSKKLLIFPLLLLLACNNEPKPPADLIQEDLYIEILTEMLMARQLSVMKQNDALEDSLIAVIHEKHKISSEQFQSTHRYYQADAVNQLERVKKAREILRQEIRNINEARELEE
jgi:hypothetical protein